MADLTARPDSWTDYLPGNWQQTINTSPVVNALSRMLNKPTPDLEGAARRQYGHQDELGSIADKEWLERSAAGTSWFERNPSAADGVNKLGLLANFLGPGVKLPAAAPKPTGIRAYHGSPHDFDKFDISKIGTGEGAQAYGRGLYFAESEGVAKSYKEGLGNKNYLLDGKPLAPKTPDEYDAHRLLQIFGPDIDTAIAEGKRHIAQGHPVDVAQFTPAVALLEKWKAQGRYKGQNTGRMYEVNIKADPDQFLDWDKPLSQQIEKAKKIPFLEKTPDGWNIYDKFGLPTKFPEDMTIDELVYRAGRIGAEHEFKDAGIPGIKYLDQQSRAAGQGSRNYVVFDDKLIEILRKYGLLPPVAAGTAAALNQQEPQL